MEEFFTTIVDPYALARETSLFSPLRFFSADLPAPPFLYVLFLASISAASLRAVPSSALETLRRASQKL
jgi:hypothetical protein